MKKLSKTELVQWLVNENDDCGRDTYFSEDQRSAITTEESYKRFMRWTKDELIDRIYTFSDEGQKFLKEGGIVDA
jgi:hypothetical protein